MDRPDKNAAESTPRSNTRDNARADSSAPDTSPERQQAGEEASQFPSQSLVESPEFTESPDGSEPAGQGAEAMLDVHPVHEGVFTWKGFLFHIATIVVGLFIAVGLEQSVEYVHHRHQQRQIEEQLLPVFSADIASDSQDIKRLADMRAALTSLRADIERQRGGQHDTGQHNTRQHDKGAVAASPNKIVIVAVVMPGMAPYEAAKENGTLALLPVEQIRMYGHIYFFRQVVMDALTQWRSATTDLAEFTERFNDYPDDAQIGGAVVLPDMTTLRPADLDEYLRLVATLIKRTDMARSFLAYFSSDCQAILDGANSDVALTNRAVQLKANPDAPSGAPQ